ncbi:unnamed protein product [Danaus chrysippus]|uniref:(African queen) hypothetical protein n=1 Tax=Danaus chrysippus TaxID=151541 RepID=A0A8J2W262_9NEOP|nr:unnamed protein product [Danaus chrysippus]
MFHSCKKLSIFIENKNAMASKGIIEKLAPLLDSPNADLVNVTLKLLFNLTFDTKLRNKMVKMSLLPKFIQFTSDDKHINLAMKILYHLSMDDRVKVLFTQSDCVKLLTDMLLLNVNSDSSCDNGPGTTDVLLALCVNLAWCERAAQQMTSEGRLRELLARAFRHRNAMLMKLVRNLSHHSVNKPLYVEFVGDIAGAVTSDDASDEFLIECLGTLSNILQSNNNIDIYAVVERYNLIPCILKILDPAAQRDPELVLECVVAAGTLGVEERAAASLAADGGDALVAALRQRQADDEHVLQTVFAFRQMLSHPKAAEHLVTKTEAPAYLIDLMQDKNVEIRKMCDSCLDIISQMPNEWAARIKVERFRCHNGQWLSVVETLGAEGGAGDAADDLPPYLSAEYLTTHRLTTSDSQISLNEDSDSFSGEADSNRAHSRNTQNGHADELLGLSDSLSGKTLEDDAQFTKSLDSFT